MKFIKLLFVFMLSTFIISCQKDSDQGVGGNGVSKVTLSISADNPYGSNSPNAKASLENEVTYEQKEIIPISPEVAIEATLTPTSVKFTKSSLNKIASTTSKDTVKTNEIEEGTLVKIYVFDSNKNYFKSLNHKYKKGASTIEIEGLNIGETYTFVAYSINSKTAVPVSSDTTKLSSLVIPNLTTEFLFHKEQITIRTGGNNVNMKLKHQFSEVFVTLEADQEGIKRGSKITQSSNPTISGFYEKASFNIDKGEATFQNALSTAKELKIISNTLGTERILSESLFVMADGIKNNTFNISSLTINGLTQSINIPNNFTIKPRVRYNLKLKVICPCVADATPSKFINVLSHNSGNSRITDTYYAGADFGAVLDFYQIDNSFNLQINGTHIYSGTRTGNVNTNEIQFQGFNAYPNADYPPNIEFADGSRWGLGSVPEIWNMNGAIFNNSTLIGGNPIIRIYISADGNISMYGSKNSAGGEPYYPLKLINGTFADNITWKPSVEETANDTLKNHIRLSQHIISTTFLTGYITGKKIVPCSSL